MKTVAIIVAAGSGKRMKSNVPKQFIEYKGRPILYYTIKAFQESVVNEIIIVTSKEYMTYVSEEVVSKYELSKVSAIIEGGKERYESVYQGINALTNTDYVLVHDGARPLIAACMINSVIEEVKKEQAVVLGVKVKDTIKVVSEEGFICETPNRDTLWMMQTPQAFEYKLIKNAYDMVIGMGAVGITDDAMVVEHTLQYPIKVIEGSYSNIKITTPEDLNLARMLGL